MVHLFFRLAGKAESETKEDERDREGDAKVAAKWARVQCAIRTRACNDNDNDYDAQAGRR